MPVAVALVAGVIVGISVTALSNAALYEPFDLAWPPNLTGFWGLFYGFFAGVVSFAITLWLSSRRFSALWKIGRLLAAAALGVFGLGVASWILMWRVSPFSLEGAWIFPLAAIPLLGAAALVKPLRRSTKTGAGETGEVQARGDSNLYR